MNIERTEHITQPYVMDAADIESLCSKLEPARRLTVIIDNNGSDSF